jgi:hypothetical protein
VNKSKYVPAGQGAESRLSLLAMTAGAREMFAGERLAMSCSPVASAAENEEVLSSLNRLSAFALFVVVTIKLTLSEPCSRRRRPAETVEAVMRTLSEVMLRLTAIACVSVMFDSPSMLNEPPPNRIEDEMDVCVMLANPG